MPGFGTEVGHSLGKEAAVTRLKDFVQTVSERFADQVSEMGGNWENDVLDFAITAMGMKITGQLTVDEVAARVNGSIPLAAMPFRGMIEQQIQAELEKALA